MNYIIYEQKAFNQIGIISAAKYIQLTEDQQKLITIHAMTNSLIMAEWCLKGIIYSASTVFNDY